MRHLPGPGLKVKVDRDTARVLRLLARVKPVRRRRVRLSRAYLRAVRLVEEEALKDRDKTWVFEVVRRATRLRAAIRLSRSRASR
jgi:hypothetical protein